jgi:hypothetical protein
MTRRLDPAGRTPVYVCSGGRRGWRHCTGRKHADRWGYKAQRRRSCGNYVHPPGPPTGHAIHLDCHVVSSHCVIRGCAAPTTRSLPPDNRSNAVLGWGCGPGDADIAPEPGRTPTRRSGVFEARALAQGRCTAALRHLSSAPRRASRASIVESRPALCSCLHHEERSTVRGDLSASY